MSVSMSLIKELRESTGAGMTECKKALEESKGDLQGAIKILRERGIAKAAKREGRSAAEGLVAIALNANKTAGAMVELNCETDFAAMSADFGPVLKAMAQAALDGKIKDVDTLLKAQIPALGKTGETALTDLLTKIGEKMTLGFVTYVEAGRVAGYIHPPGKIGVLVAASVEGGNAAALDEALQDVAMHVAASAPRFLKREDVDSATLATEKEIFAALARKEGKPEAMIPKIVEGRVSSFYKEACLLEQPFVKEPKLTVAKVIEEAGKAAGAKVALSGFVRRRVGEGAAPATETE